MKCYSEYTKNYNSSRTLADKLNQSNPKFKDFLDTCQKIPASKNLNLTSLLITPVQRIPRIILLFYELCKHTEADHPDHEDIHKTSQMVQDVVRDMNNIIKQAENTDKIIKIQTAFNNSFILLEPGRLLVKEGTATLLGTKKKTVSLFLFNDILLLANKKSGSTPSYVLEERISLPNCVVPESNAEGMSLDITAPNNRWTLIFKNVNERNVWNSEVNKQIKGLLEKEGQIVNAKNMTKRAKAIITKESAVRLSVGARKGSF